VLEGSAPASSCRSHRAQPGAQPTHLEHRGSGAHCPIWKQGLSALSSLLDAGSCLSTL